MANRRTSWNVYNKAVVAEIERPEDLVAQLQKAADGARQLVQEYERLRDRIGQAEEESLRFAERHAKVEQQLELLQNLFVSLHRLHATMVPEDVLLTIKEILINFVGAQRFAIWLGDDRGQLSLVDHEGFAAAKDVPLPDPEMAKFGHVIVPSDGEPTWIETGPPGMPKSLAMVPLRIGERQIGLITIHGLFKQKDVFNALDAQIFELLSEQGGPALMAARLYDTQQRQPK